MKANYYAFSVELPHGDDRSESSRYLICVLVLNQSNPSDKTEFFVCLRS